MRNRVYVRYSLWCSHIEAKSIEHEPHKTYSGVPNSQTRLTINSVEKIPGVILVAAIDTV